MSAENSAGDPHHRASSSQDPRSKRLSALAILDLLDDGPNSNRQRRPLSIITTSTGGGSSNPGSPLDYTHRDTSNLHPASSRVPVLPSTASASSVQYPESYLGSVQGLRDPSSGKKGPTAISKARAAAELPIRPGCHLGGEDEVACVETPRGPRQARPRSVMMVLDPKRRFPDRNETATAERKKESLYRGSPTAPVTNTAPLPLAAMATGIVRAPLLRLTKAIPSTDIYHLTERLSELIVTEVFGCNLVDLPNAADTWLPIRRMVQELSQVVGLGPRESQGNIREVAGWQCAPAGASSQGTSDRHHRGSAAGSKRGNRQAGFEQSNRDPGDDGENLDGGDEDGGEHPNKRPYRKQSAEKIYSCPFRKRNPLRFNMREYDSCATLNRADLATVKRHIRIVHKWKPPEGIEKVCEKCRSPFRCWDDYVDHFAPDRSCRSQPEQPARDERKNPEDGITDEIEEQLVGRKYGTKIDTWEKLWMVLFPGDITYLPETWIKPIPIEMQEVHVLVERIATSLSRELGPAMELTLGRIQDLSNRHRPMVIGMLSGTADSVVTTVHSDHLQRFGTEIKGISGDNPLPIAQEHAQRLLPRGPEPSDRLDIDPADRSGFRRQVSREEDRSISGSSPLLPAATTSPYGPHTTTPSASTPHTSERPPKSVQQRRLAPDLRPTPPSQVSYPTMHQVSRPHHNSMRDGSPGHNSLGGTAATRPASSYVQPPPAWNLESSNYLPHDGWSEGGTNLRPSRSSSSPTGEMPFLPGAGVDPSCLTTNNTSGNFIGQSSGVGHDLNPGMAESQTTSVSSPTDMFLACDGTWNETPGCESLQLPPLFPVTPSWENSPMGDRRASLEMDPRRQGNQKWL